LSEFIYVQVNRERRGVTPQRSVRESRERSHSLLKILRGTYRLTRAFLLSAYSQFSPFTIPVEPLPTAQDESVMQKVMTKKIGRSSKLYPLLKLISIKWLTQHTNKESYFY